MDPIISRVKVWKCFYGLTIKTNNFAFEAKIILGLESTWPDNLGAKTRLNGSNEQ